MAWIRVDDHFDEHPKLAMAGPLGWAMWLAGLAYCNRNLTDGFIPWSRARSLVSWEFLGEDDGDERGRKVYSVSLSCGMVGEDVTSALVIDRLVSAGLWDEVDGGYRVHDYDQYQPSKAQIEADRASNAERQAKWRERNAESNAKSNAVTKTVTNEPVTSPPNPNPNPNPNPSPKPKAKTNTSMGTKKNDENAHARAGSSSEPFDALVALCDATGTDVSALSGTVRGKQANKAKHLLASGMTVEEIGRLAGYCASQSWRSEPVDMFTVEKERGKWELAGKPAIAQAKPQANGRASPGKPSNYDISAANIDAAFGVEPFGDGPVFETTGRIAR